MITERQGEILNRIVQEYISLATPVSSKLLEKKHNFQVSPATIRNEMQKLTDEGYLFQPHTSAGRVPTDKGYRFFVNGLLEHMGNSDMSSLRSSQEPPRFRSGPGLRYSSAHIRVSSGSPMQEIIKFLAEESSDLALGYLADEKIIWKDGWQDIFEEPEFLEPGLAANFAKMIDDFEENIEEVFSPELKVFIGKENPVSKTDDFSIITVGFDGGLLALLGPKRMSYDENIALIQKLWRKI